jgi:hypothetical protein
MALLADLAEIEGEISATRQRLTDVVLRAERDKLREELIALQNRAMRLMHDYIDLIAPPGSLGDWEITVVHRDAQVAACRRRVVGQWVKSDDNFWRFLRIEFDGAVKAILALEGRPAPERPEAAYDRATTLMHDDMVELLNLLKLGDHARPISPHEVMQQEILPRIRELAGYTE